MISAAGDDPKFHALVYVAAHQPDVGESIAELNGRFPLPAHVEQAGVGSIIVAPAHFHADVAADVEEDKAQFLADAQRPTATIGFTTRLTVAAWHTKPSWAIVARQDHILSPALERWMYARSKAVVVELDASHSVQISRPADVAAVIGRAATGRGAASAPLTWGRRLRPGTLAGSQYSGKRNREQVLGRRPPATVGLTSGAVLPLELRIWQAS